VPLEEGTGLCGTGECLWDAVELVDFAQWLQNVSEFWNTPFLSSDCGFGFEKLIAKKYAKWQTKRYT
jgi:hypothetical protein